MVATTWGVRCLLWGFVSGPMTAYVAAVYLFGDVSTPCKVTAGVFVLLGSLSTAIALHISTLCCSQTHTLKTLLTSYVMGQMASLLCVFITSKLKADSQRPLRAQEALLRRLIARDLQTEYGKRYLRGIETLQDYRQKHPLTKYDHYEGYFQRLADGEKNVCLAGGPERFGISSGTTGKGKLIPIVPTRGMYSALALSTMGVVKPSPLQRYALLYCKPAVKFTKSGLPVAPFMFIPTAKGEGRPARSLLDAVQNAPFEAFAITTDFEATYVHLLFALTDRHIYSLTTTFASHMYRVFSMLEERGDGLAEDVALGRVSPGLAIDEGLRRTLDSALRPNPARARELREEMSRGFVGIASRIWPHMTCIKTIDISGYMEKLNARYTKGLKMYSAFYACTESLIGFNLWMDGRQQQYVIAASDVLVEFIPERCSDQENPDTLLIDEVQAGHRYEIALTTNSGFYRYRVGDVVEVVGFHENCPIIQIRYRTGELLNLRSEKIDKLVVSSAIEECLSKWPESTLVEWTCAESPLLCKDNVAGYDMYYLLFIELESDAEIHLSEEQRAMFDESLRQQHELYDRYRHVGSICQSRVLVVRPGTFRRLQDLIIATSTASYNQFKMPKKLRTRATLDLMMGGVLGQSSSSCN